MQPTYLNELNEERCGV